MIRQPTAERRTWGLFGSFVIHAAILGLVWWIGPMVRDTVWTETGDGSGGGAPPASAMPFVGSSRAGGAPTPPTGPSRLQQVVAAMAEPPAPQVRVRLASERVLDHLWQSTAFALVIGWLVFTLRRNRARVRHALWLAASVKFLVPMALIIAAGRAVSPGIDGLVAHPLVAGIREPLTAISRPALWPASATLDPARVDWMGLGIVVAWLGGFAVIAALRFWQWRRLTTLVETSEPLELAGIDVPESIEVRTAAGLMEPGVVGWQQPVLLMPAGIDRLLTAPEIEAIVAHELCHARRFDNLTGAVHMVVEAMFWFHPLVWWIGTRLVNERERACDEHVLRTVGHPVSYANGILTICKRYVQPPLACVSGVGTSNVRKRLEAILANRVGERIGPWRRAVVATTIALVLIVPLSVGAMSAPWLPARPLRPAPPTVAVAIFLARADGRNPGPQITRSSMTFCEATPTVFPCGGVVTASGISASGITSAELAALVARVLGHPVVNRTGLEGRYDVHLTWTEPGPKPSSLLRDLEQQLGLTLVSIDPTGDRGRIR